MQHLVGHVVRRGFQAVDAASAASEKPDMPDLPDIPAWGLLILTTTVIFFTVILSVIDYTYGHVVTTLTMVESPTAVLFEPLNSEGPDAAPKFDGKIKDQGEPLVMKQQMITSKIRTTTRHLRARAGFWSGFRGFSIYIIYGFLVTQFTLLLNVPWIPSPVASILATAIFARLGLTWTHIVISESSPKPWFKRLASFSAYKKIVIPTVVLAACEQLTVGLPLAFFYTMGMDTQMDPEVLKKMSCEQQKLLLIKFFALFVLGLCTGISLVVPATVSLTRVQASLLSDEEETIVPFDRSFGGKVVPEIVGGSGVVSMIDAWKTFDWNSRVRLLKMYVKVFALQVTTMMTCVAVLAIQLRLLLGSEGMEKSAILINAAFANKE